ncbi:MAG: hypothetical protein E3J64_00560 [Anaerolineales bacterium]|nr:MAG: hypothetical protein E3J64_00560 [Anaerolineales bacterium]
MAEAAEVRRIPERDILRGYALAHPPKEALMLALAAQGQLLSDILKELRAIRGTKKVPSPLVTFSEASAWPTFTGKSAGSPDPGPG